MHRGIAALAVLVLTAAIAGCGSDADGDGRGEVFVSAATSLKSAFTSYGAGFERAEAQFSFAGSDELAAQIRSGAGPDVFASANTKLPDQLFAEGLVERPQVFASNRLVLAVPADADGIGSLGDVARDGTTVVIGAESVPIGSYTREVLTRLGRGERDRILANVRTSEPDVASIVGKLSQGAVDAGFVYVTDIRAAAGALRAVEIPARLRPDVAYAAAVVAGAGDDARKFVDGLRGAPALRRAGFGPP